MKNNDLVRKALKDFNEISNFISQYNGNLSDCCSVLGGHNLTDNQFDLNFKNICVTIMRDDFTNKLYVDKDSTENTIEIYDGDNLYDTLSYSQLLAEVAFVDFDDRDYFGKRFNLATNTFTDNGIKMNVVNVYEDDDLIDDEDYRFLVDVNGYAIITFWYLPTRVKDVVFITGAEMEMC